MKSLVPESPKNFFVRYATLRHPTSRCCDSNRARRRKATGFYLKEPDKVFDPVVYLANAGLHRRIVQFKSKAHLFSQGTNADSVFYIQKGRAKLTVVSKAGKEATITLLSAGDFVGEESVAA